MILRVSSYWVSLMIMLAMAGFGGCIGGPDQDANSLVVNEPAPAVTEPAAGPESPQLPPFPGPGNPEQTSASHVTSTVETAVPGNTAIDQHGENNYPDNDIEALVIAPGAEDDLAWGMYSLNGLTFDRPVNIDIEVAAAPLVPGGDDPLPLSYWAGLANYTSFSWEWFGPFESSQSLQINSTELLDRYVNESAVMYFTFVVQSGEEFESPENPDGLAAAQITVSTVMAEDANSEDYNSSKPIFVPIETQGTSSLPPKGGSDLDPLQHITIDWSHYQDPWSGICSSTEYQVFRQGPDDPQPVQIGSVTAPASIFVDPVDALDGVAEPLEGVTYTYFLRGHNDRGSSANSSVRLTIPLLTWARSWGGSAMDIIRDISVAPDGTVYATGVTQSFGQGNLDLLLLSYDGAGNLQKKFVWGDVAEDSGQDIFCDSLGNKYVTGRTLSLVGSQEIILLKFDSNDDLVWEKHWTGITGTRGLAVWVDPTGDFIYVSGQVQATQTDTVMIKLDANGNTVWSNQWSGPGNSTGYDFAVDASGNVYVTGFINTATRDDDALLLKYDQNGDLQWEKSWGTVQEDEGNGIVLDDEGNIYIAGFTFNWPFIIKVDPNGNLLWQQRWEPASGTAGKAWNVLFSDGRLYFAGEWEGDMFLVEVEAQSGDLVDDWTWGLPVINESVFGMESAGDYLVFAGFGQSAANLSREEIEGFFTSPTAGTLIDVTGANGFNLLGLLSDMVSLPFEIPGGIENTGGGGSDTVIVRITP